LACPRGGVHSSARALAELLLQEFDLAAGDRDPRAVREALQIRLICLERLAQSAQPAVRVAEPDEGFGAPHLGGGLEVVHCARRLAALERDITETGLRARHLREELERLRECALRGLHRAALERSFAPPAQLDRFFLRGLTRELLRGWRA